MTIIGFIEGHRDIILARLQIKMFIADLLNAFFAEFNNKLKETHFVFKSFWVLFIPKSTKSVYSSFLAKTSCF